MKEASATLGISGRIARFFLGSRLTPLLALVALLLGLFAALVTPREEEPQINVTMANVMIPFPGASAKDVEQMVATPAEQVLAQIADVKHVYSVSRPGMAIITVEYAVGVPRTEALVRLHDVIQSNKDWLPAGLGVGEPIVKPKGIDDVPIVALTLYSKRPEIGAFELERVAHSIEAELKHVKGTREVVTLGGPGRAINVALDPARMRAGGVTVGDLQGALRAANAGRSLGDVVSDNAAVEIAAGPFLADARDVSELIVGVHAGRPVFLGEVATVRDGAPAPERWVWHTVTGKDGGEYPAVTMTITKKPGQNAVKVAEALIAKLDSLKNSIIPADVLVDVTRNYGVTADEKATKLIQKLVFATLAVVVLVFIALGRREAAIVGTAVILTLTATLFASWAWGFTLNRVSLFALIFSIGILVDDAIVVVENIHRHMKLNPGRPLKEFIPAAVDEVGGPTILATFTVIAALMPMAFVSGLMGPYMQPIPINASMGMMISLAIAFIVTPWLSGLWLKPSHHEDTLAAKAAPWFRKLFAPFLDDNVVPPDQASGSIRPPGGPSQSWGGPAIGSRGKRNRRLLGAGVLGLIAVSLALPVFQLVVLKMLPLDNKSEFQVVVDMPAGTPPERTAALLHALGAEIGRMPETRSFEAYVGLAAPITFNGLVRQYYLRAGGEVGDLQVNLVNAHLRKDKSHVIVERIRPALQKIAEPWGARIKVVEVPPGPPVMAPLVAEVYGPGDDTRLAVAKTVRKIFDTTPGIVDSDDSSIVAAPKRELVIDRRKAALLGIAQSDIVDTLAAGLAGTDVAYLHDASKYPAAARLRLPVAARGDLGDLLKLGVRGASGRLVPLGELVSVENAQREQPLHHKDLLPVIYVMGDFVGGADSPLYGLFAMRDVLRKVQVPGGDSLGETFISQPDDPQREFAIKWDGEWQITYETFRDMGAAYAVGLILIYLLVVAQFGSYLTPLVIMAPIPLTLIGVLPGHALLGAQFTATSMIGMMALGGIIVRNSILLVDFINLQVETGTPFKEAVVNSAITRAQPILLTAFSAMLGALFILDDPIFNGLAVSLIFGIFVSTLLTLLVIPLLYYAAYRGKFSH